MCESCEARSELSLELLDLQARVTKAIAVHGQYASYHEAYGVLCEEVRELFDHICAKADARDHDALRAEALDVATVAVKLALLASLKESK